MPSLSITCTTPATGTVGTSYSQTFTASGGTTPYAFSVASGSVPFGLTLDSATGIVSGTPVVSGVNTFVVQVTDAASATATVSDTISIPGGLGWLIINEPTIGLTDRSTYLSFAQGNKHGYSQILRQRGQATIPLLIQSGDTYAPTRGCPIYLYDITSTGGAIVFSGLIQNLDYQWLGIDGDRICTITAVSLESVFDTIYAPPFQYVNQTCGFIVADLLARLEAGCPVSAGRIDAGVSIPLLVCNYEKIADLFDSLATTSAFTWAINPQTSQLYFQAPADIAAPFTVTDSDVLWDSVQWKLDGADYRNRQAVKLSYDAFGHSMEFFPGSGQQSITLRNPVNQVVAAYATLSTCNVATGSFSGQPTAGDTITIEPATGIWQANHIYALGGIVVVDGYVQKITFAGTSGPTIPTFLTVTGDTTIDDTVIWTCQGPSGLGTGTDTYTFVSAIDNTQFGQILIGSSATDTCQNLYNCINADPVTRGTTFSLPTWECGQCNAIDLSGTSFTLQQKAAGQSWVASISTTSTTFSWSGDNTSGGTSPQGSLGPGEGATIVLGVYVTGTSTAAPAVAYTPGSSVITLASPLNVGSNLNVDYTRADGNVVECEDTNQVTALATLSHGTGKVQQITDASSQGLVGNSSAAGLLLCQTALAAYSVTPSSFNFDTYLPGLYPGMTVTVALTADVDGDALLNGEWVIEEVDATMIPIAPYMDLLGHGHYRYSVKMVDAQQVDSYMDFWEGLGGGTSSSGLVATSGGALTPGAVPGTFPLDFSDANNSGVSFITPSGGMNAFKYDCSSFMNSTCTGCTFTGNFNNACFKNATLTNATLTGNFVACDFTNATVTGMTLSGTFTNCNFTNATISGTGITASGCNFSGSDFTAAGLNTGDFHGSCFLGCTFLNTIMTGSNFKNCVFAGVLFKNASFDSSLFTGTSSAPTCLNNCTLVNTSTTGTTFDGSNLNNTLFVNSGPVGTPPTVIGCNLAGTLFLDTQVQPITSTYTATPFDCSTLLSVSASVTITLPSPSALSSTWQVSIKNTSGGVVTVDPSGVTIDGVGGTVALGAGTGMRVLTDGSVFYTA